jgi:hypothetical protein
MDPQELFGPVATRTHQIDNFDTFILNHVPYGQVQPSSLQWGALQYDGPGVTGYTGAKPALQWHFGGVPYPISRAIRIQYSYMRTFDGSNALTVDQIFLGFQDSLTDFVLPQPIPYVRAPTPTFRTRVQSLGPFGGFSNPVWASDSGVLASEASSLVTRSYLFDPTDPYRLNSFIREELSPSQPSFDALVINPIAIDFDGPAQDSNSHRVFPYTFETLRNDPYKYGQLLFWYFGGKPYRVTKAMRIPLDLINTPGATQPSRVLSAVRDANDTPITITQRLAQLVKAADAAAQKAAAVAPARAATASGPGIAAAGSSGTIATPSGSTTTQPAATPDPEPMGHALFIGYGGAGDPGG